MVGVLQGLEQLKGKAQADMRKWGQRFFDTEFAGQAKVVDASNITLLGRTLGTTPARRLHWRSVRSYLIADSIDVVPPDDSSETGKYSTLHVRGYIRGRPLDVNQVIHLGDAGHFRMRQINSASEPCPLNLKHDARAHEKPPAATGTAVEVLAVADPSEQEDLSVEAEVDGLAGEQTWPTENELAQAALNNVAGREEASGDQETQPRGGSQSHVRKSVPQGWSGYQAEWLADGSSVEEEQAEESDEDAWELEGQNKDHSDDGLGDLTDASRDIVKRRSAEDEDMRFPDEVDTPADRSARERFARFRALKSFRTSPWDPKESLPADYARIFQVKSGANSLHATINNWTLRWSTTWRVFYLRRVEAFYTTVEDRNRSELRPVRSRVPLPQIFGNIAPASPTSSARSPVALVGSDADRRCARGQVAI